MKKLSGLKKKIIIFSFIVLIIVICAYVIYNLFFMSKYRISNYDKERIHNFGEEYVPSQYVCYGTKNNCVEVIPTVDGSVDVNTLGKYELRYHYQYKGKELLLTQTIEVKDVVGPTINVKNTEDITVCPNGNSNDLELEITDNYDTEITNISKRIENNKLIIEATDSNNNTSIKEVKVTVNEDKDKPIITINGNKTVNHILGVKYEDKGATVKDNCDDNITFTTTGEVDVNKEGTYYITYTATDLYGNKEEVKRKVIVNKKQAGQRVIYLTFDDGPGGYTAKLLDVLKKYDVKATFFVTCKGDDSLIKREYDEGHTVALHTCSHDYASIYTSTTDYFDDLYKVRDRVKRITGYESNIIRFPGGSSNTTSKKYDGGTHIMSTLSKEVVKRGFYYFDWNISSGDAGGTTSSDGVYNNVIRSLKPGSSVVLQHDIKKYSVEAVERIIQYGLANGYTFERLTESSPKVRHGINN